MKKSLLTRLSETLTESTIPHTVDGFSDNSASWIEMSSQDMSISIVFGIKGKRIEWIAVFKKTERVEVDEVMVMKLQALPESFKKL